MHVIMAAVVSVADNLSMTETLPYRYDNYQDCLYRASAYKSSVNDIEGPVMRVREVECRPG